MTAVQLIFNLARLLLVCAVVWLFSAEYLERSLGTSSPLKILTKATGILASRERAEATPFKDELYWKVDYVDGNVGTLPFPHYWPVHEMLLSIENQLASSPMQSLKSVALLTNY